MKAARFASKPWLPQQVNPETMSSQTIQPLIFEWMSRNSVALRFSFWALAGDILERFGWTVSLKIVRSRLLKCEGEPCINLKRMAVALLFMILSMLCWGSSANTLKLCPGFRFQLFTGIT